MGRTVKLSRVETVFADLSYPISRSEATDRLDDVTLLLADGEANLGEVVADARSDTFDSSDDLESELYNVLPREAVGEPYQSEGEG